MTVTLHQSVFSAQLTTSDLNLADISCGMRKENYKNSGLVSAHLHSVAWWDGQPNCWILLNSRPKKFKVFMFVPYQLEDGIYCLHEDNTFE